MSLANKRSSRLISEMWVDAVLSTTWSYGRHWWRARWQIVEDACTGRNGGCNWWSTLYRNHPQPSQREWPYKAHWKAIDQLAFMIPSNKRGSVSSDSRQKTISHCSRKNTWPSCIRFIRALCKVGHHHLWGFRNQFLVYMYFPSARTSIISNDVEVQTGMKSIPWIWQHA